MCEWCVVWDLLWKLRFALKTKNCGTFLNQRLGMVLKEAGKVQCKILVGKGPWFGAPRPSESRGEGPDHSGIPLPYVRKAPTLLFPNGNPLLAMKPGKKELLPNFRQPAGRCVCITVSVAVQYSEQLALARIQSPLPQMCTLTVNCFGKLKSANSIEAEVSEYSICNSRTLIIPTFPELGCGIIMVLSLSDPRLINGDLPTPFFQELRVDVSFLFSN